MTFCASCGEANVAPSGHYVCGGSGHVVILKGAVVTGLPVGATEGLFHERKEHGMNGEGWGEAATAERTERHSGLHEIGDEIKGLAVAIDELENRLGPILENYPADLKGQDVEAIPSTALRGHARDIARLRTKLASLTGRLDLP